MAKITSRSWWTSTQKSCKGRLWASLRFWLSETWCSMTMKKIWSEWCNDDEYVSLKQNDDDEWCNDDELYKTKQINTMDKIRQATHMFVQWWCSEWCNDDERSYRRSEAGKGMHVCALKCKTNTWNIVAQFCSVAQYVGLLVTQAEAWCWRGGTSVTCSMWTHAACW